MKKNILLLLFAFSINSITTLGQDYFKGSIIFKSHTTSAAFTLPIPDSIKYNYDSNQLTITYYTPNNYGAVNPIVKSEYQSPILQTRDLIFQSNLGNEIKNINISSTNEFSNILGYRCQKYLVTRITKDNHELISFWWIALNLKVKGSVDINGIMVTHCPLRFEIFREHKSDSSKNYKEISEAFQIRL